MKAKQDRSDCCFNLFLLRPIFIKKKKKPQKQLLKQAGESLSWSQSKHCHSQWQCYWLSLLIKAWHGNCGQSAGSRLLFWTNCSKYLINFACLGLYWGNISPIWSFLYGPRGPYKKDHRDLAKKDRKTLYVSWGCYFVHCISFKFKIVCVD